MRTLTVLLTLIVFAPVAVNGAEMSKSDRYYACLVGNGAVAIVNGKTSEQAFDIAIDACETEAAEADTEPGGDIGSAAEGVEEAASVALDKLAT